MSSECSRKAYDFKTDKLIFIFTWIVRSTEKRSDVSFYFGISFFSFHGSTALLGLDRRIVEVFTSHSVRHATLGRVPLDEWSDRRREFYLTTHNTHKRQTTIPPVGLEFSVHSKKASAGRRLRRRGHWDWSAGTCGKRKKVKKFTHSFTILDPSCCFSGTIYRKPQELGKIVHFTIQ